MVDWLFKSRDKLESRPDQPRQTIPDNEEARLEDKANRGAEAAAGTADGYRAAVRETIDSEVRVLFQVQIHAAAQELADEQRKAIREMVERQKQMVKEVLEGVKATIRVRAEELGRAVKSPGER